jgi:putative transposase
LGLIAGPVPARVDAIVKAGVLDLIDHAVDHGWSARAACEAIGLDYMRAARWAGRREEGRLADLAPGGHPVHGLLDWERAEILALHTEWGQRDRSHRKLAHRGSYLERVWVSESTVRKVLAAEGLLLPGNPPREPIPRSPWPDWLEWKPNRVWGYDFKCRRRHLKSQIQIELGVYSTHSGKGLRVDLPGLGRGRKCLSAR